MRVHLASYMVLLHSLKLEHLFLAPKYVLESFAYFDIWGAKHEYLDHYHDTLLLDSGIYTLVEKAMKVGRNPTEREMLNHLYAYCEFINKRDINQFIDMDADYLVGFQRADNYRKIIERETGKKPIPVWHMERGLEWFKHLCRNYPYVAIAGFTGKTFSSSRTKKYLPQFMKIARENGNPKIHALGFGRRDMNQYGLYSTDCSTWAFTGIGGDYAVFDGQKIVRKHLPPGKLTRVKLHEHNIKQWILYQNYLDRSDR